MVRHGLNSSVGDVTLSAGFIDDVFVGNGDFFAALTAAMILVGFGSLCKVSQRGTQALGHLVFGLRYNATVLQKVVGTFAGVVSVHLFTGHLINYNRQTKY